MKEIFEKNEIKSLSNRELTELYGGNPFAYGIGIRMLWSVLEDPNAFVNGFLDCFE